MEIPVNLDSRWIALYYYHLKRGYPVSGGMMAIIFVTVSALLQFASAWLALRLIPLTKGRWGMAWVFVSSAIFLMALRRCISVYRLLSAPDTGKFDLTAELFAFAVSVLMFAGFLRLRDMFIEMGEKNSLDLKAMNEALKEAALKSENEKARAESIIAGFGDGLIIQDKNYRVIYQNKLQKDIIGDKTGELCHKAFMGLDNICPDCPIEMSFKDGGVHRTVHSVDNGDGIRHFELTASPLFDSGGRITAGIKIVRDITAFKRAMEELTKSRTLLSKSQQLARMGSWERELATGRMTWSDEMFGIFGLDPASGPPSFEDFLMMVHAEDRENLRQTVGCAIAERSGYTIEYRIIKPDGSERNILAEGMVTVDESGTPALVFGIAKDITERKRSQEALRKSHRMLEESQRVARIGSWEWDIINNRIAWSEEVYRLFGWSPGAFDAKYETFLASVHPDDRERLNAAVLESVSARKPYSIDARIMKHDGGEWVMEAKGEVICDDDGIPVTMRGTAQDITERKLAEIELNKYRENLEELVDIRTTELREAYKNLEAESSARRKMEDEIIKAQKLESLGILAGGIAHDFNNSMTAIMTNLEIAKLSISNNGEAAKRLDAAEHCIRRAQSLTRQLLTFAKGGEPVKKSLHVGDLIRDTVDFALHGSNVACEYCISGDLFPVEADEGQLSHALNNLVINARQAMPDGGRMLVKAENADASGPDGNGIRLAPGKYVCITIKDNGPGIAKDIMAKIFDPYFTTKQNGSGLGLTTAYSIVKKHGGNITAGSDASGGAVFKIHLPATEKPVSGDLSKKDGPAKGSGLVLLMEDEALIAMSVADLMRESGYEVVHAGEGETALREFKGAMDSGRPFDAVVLDLTILGGMGGRETMKKLIEIDPNVKAIVASGYSNDPIMSNYGEYGFSGIVPKPYDIGQLATEINRITAMKV